MLINKLTRKTCFLIPLFLLATIRLHAQVIITIPSFQGSLIKPDMLWNLVVINQGQQFEGVIQVTVTDRNKRSLLTGYSTTISFPKGAKTVLYSSATPINYTYNQLSNGNEWFSVGKYNVCFTITKVEPTTKTTIFGSNGQGKSEVLDNECAELNIEPINPPLLNQPADKTNIYDIRPALMWQPPSPLQIFTDVKYELRLVEIAKGQTAAQAITNNTPVLIENELTQPAQLYPPSYNPLEINHEYAWQVTAYNSNYSVKSEYWQFKVVEDTIMNKVQQSPFLQMNNVNTVAIGTMEQGFIKVIINNASSDSTATLCLTEIGDPSNCIVSIDVFLKYGENYIVKQIAGKIRLDEKKIYQLIWIDSNKEKMILRYKPKYYN